MNNEKTMEERDRVRETIDELDDLFTRQDLSYMEVLNVLTVTYITAFKHYNSVAPCEDPMLTVEIFLALLRKMFRQSLKTEES